MWIGITFQHRATSTRFFTSDVASDMLYRKIEGPSNLVPLCVNLCSYPHIASRVCHFEINIDQRSCRFPRLTSSSLTLYNSCQPFAH